MNSLNVCGEGLVALINGVRAVECDHTLCHGLPFFRSCLRSVVGRAPLISVAFVEEDLGMFTSPSRAALPIFADDDAKPNARATVAVLTALTQ
jgi:hypothetical protein